MEELNALWFCISLWYFYSNKSYEIVTKSVSNAHRKKCYKPLLPGRVSYKFTYLFHFLIFFLQVYEKNNGLVMKAPLSLIYNLVQFSTYQAGI